MPKLIAKSGLSSRTEFDFQGDVILGRGPKPDISIPNSTISRSHARISRVDGGWIITDLQSGNGTAVGGMLVKEPTPLHHGDEVQLGGVVFRFLEDREAPSHETTKTRLRLLRTEVDTRQVLHTIEAAEDPVASMLPGDHVHMMLAMNRRLQLISEIGKAIGQTLDEETLLDLVLEKLFEVFPQTRRGFILRYRSETDELLPTTARTRTGESSEIQVSESLVRDVISSRRAILSSDAMSDERFVGAESLVELRIRSVLCAPLIADDQIHGVIQLDTDLDNAFAEADMALLLGIAGQSALSLANASLHKKLLQQELVQRDLALATKIQQSFLPQQPPQVPGYEFHDRYLSALEIGGDYYDFLELPDGHLGIALGDVSGKGISAALYMAKLSAEVRYRSAGQTEPGVVLERLNKALAKRSESGMFVTLIFLSLETQTGRLKVASAGHPPPLLRRANGQIVKFESARNVPLGIALDTKFRQETIQLEPGATLIVYTDGVTEATNARQEEFGEHRLAEALRGSQGSPGKVLNSVLDAVMDFQGEEPQADDITLVCFGPTGSP
ncbi:MAG: SpoIIE family protein phosphatase [Thermoanaerobaculia bacterium]